MTTQLHIHADRSGKFITGVITRALDPETGKKRAADISELTPESLSEWLASGRKLNKDHAELVIKTLLGHDMPEHTSAHPHAMQHSDAEVARTREKLIARANEGDALVAELANEVMKYVLDLLEVIDEPYNPASASMVGLLITENAGRTKTSRAMWSQYRNEDAPASVTKFRAQISGRSGKDS